LIETLQDLVGAPKADLAARSHVTELAYDDVPQIRFPGSTFCVTGDFLFGSRDSCAAAITKRGGLFVGRVTTQLSYLVIGNLGSPEWKHGSFGTKIENAMEYKQRGLPIKIVRETVWSAALSEHR
jgi:NAD-dependent DNA ligase